MLFLTDFLIDQKQRLLQDVEDGKIDPELACRQALKLDPDDFVALVMLASLHAGRGETAEAEELLWRAVQAQPCAWRPYFELARLLKDQGPLSKGLIELGCRKLLLAPEDLDEIEDDPSEVFDMMERAEDMDIGAAFEMWADSLRAQRDLEPLDVTARLRPLRLMHQLQDTEFPEPELVDAVVQEGEAIVPLLVGVLRGWAQDVVPEEDVFVVTNSTALLGEIGQAMAFPSLLELVTMVDPYVSGPCGWALDRISEHQPEQSVQKFWEVAPRLEGGQRIAVAERLLRYPQMVIPASLLERLFDNLDLVDKEARGFCFEVLVNTAVMVLGRPGFEFARTMLRRHGGALSKKSRRNCDEMIEELSSIEIPARPPAEPSPYTIYDICGGEVDWEEEEEKAMEADEDSHPPGTVRRSFTPGRNDPCWCGSGKKYKKCHLDSDEASERGVTAPGPDDLQARLIDFLTRETPRREGRIATSEFFGSDDIDEEVGPMVLMDWMLHDRIWKVFGRTVIEEFIVRNSSSLTDYERQFLESSARSYMDLFEVREVNEGKGVEVKSLTSNQEFFVNEVHGSNAFVPGDGMFSRLVTGEHGLEFSDVALGVPRKHLDAIRQALDEDKRGTSLSWPGYLKTSWPRVYALSTHVLEK